MGGDYSLWGLALKFVPQLTRTNRQTANSILNSFCNSRRGDYLNLASRINERLWSAVRVTYETGNYSGAIADSIYYLSDLIRNKSGLDSDGVQLVNASFGGTAPVVKVNALNTQSDLDEQKGVQFLLMGIYTAIRNPRSHEKRTDTVETADSIIGFIDYLTKLIDSARSPFDADQVIGQVFDPYFGQSNKYASLIVERVPIRKLLDILLQIFHRRSDGPIRNIVLFTKAALKTLSAEEQASFWLVASDALESTRSDSDFIKLIQITQENWEKISEIARLRTEHVLVKSVREGEYSSLKKTCMKGSLGTWITGIAEKLTLKREYESAVSLRISSEQQDARAYAYEYHFGWLRTLCPTPPTWVINRLRKLLEANDRITYEALSFVATFQEIDPFTEESCEDKWAIALKDAYEAYVPTSEITDDDIPF